MRISLRLCVVLGLGSAIAIVVGVVYAILAHQTTVSLTATSLVFRRVTAADIARRLEDFLLRPYRHLGHIAAFAAHVRWEPYADPPAEFISFLVSVMHEIHLHTTAGMTFYAGTPYGNFYGVQGTPRGLVFSICSNQTKWSIRTTPPSAPLTDFPLSGPPLSNFTETMATVYNVTRRSWYQVGAAAGERMWSEVYFQLLLQALCMPAVAPIRRSGSLVMVLGLDVDLGYVGQVLAAIANSIDEDAVAFVTDRSRMALVATSVPNLSVLAGSPDSSGRVARIAPTEAQNPVISQAAAALPTYPLPLAEGKTLTINGVRYYLDLHQLGLDNLDWEVVFACPRSRFMASYDHSRAVFGGIVAGTSAVIVGIAVAAAVTITSSLGKLAGGVRQLGKLQFAISRQRQSVFFEIAVLQRVFGELLERVALVREFLPEVVVDAVRERCEESSNRPEGAAEGRRGATSSTSTWHPVGPRSAAHPGGGGGAAAGASRRPSHAIGRVDLSLGLWVTPNVTVLCANITGFHELLVQQPLPEVERTHEAYVRTVYRKIKERRGVPDRFLGDQILATWNAYCCRTTHIVDALSVATEARQALINIETRWGIASGFAHSGVLGCEEMKYHAVLGPVVDLARSLEQFCKCLGAAVLTSCGTEAMAVFRTRLIGRVTHAQFPQPITVSEVLGVRSEQADSAVWMSVATAAGAEEESFASAVALMEKGDHAGALLRLLAPEHDGDSVANNLAARCRWKIAHGECAVVPRADGFVIDDITYASSESFQASFP